MTLAPDEGGARRSGGRPTREAAAAIGGHIVAVATRLFLEHGFGATSIEAVAAATGISKRTFYHRFRDKPDLFRAVVHRLIARWSTAADAAFMPEGGLEEVLRRSARQIVGAALSPEALQLYRILIAEAPRFPELAAILSEQSAAGWRRLTQLFAREMETGTLAAADPLFVAEQFANMVLAAPRRRALGLGPPMNAGELERWIDRSVALFLDGLRARP